MRVYRKVSIFTHNIKILSDKENLKKNFQGEVLNVLTELGGQVFYDYYLFLSRSLEYLTPGGAKRYGNCTFAAIF